MNETYYGFRFLALALILGANALFAASEVALVSVRPSRLRELAEEGSGGAQAALSLLANPGRLLSVVQVGVTLASLGLGWAGQDTIYRFFLGLLGSLLTPTSRKAPARGEFRLRLPADDLLSCGGGRSGAQEPGDREGGPPGHTGGARAAVVLSDRGAVRLRDRALRGGALQADRPARRTARGRTFRRGAEADRELRPRRGRLAQVRGRRNSPCARPGGALRSRDHGAAQRHRLGVRRRPSRGDPPRHDRPPVLARAGLRRAARADHRGAALQGPAALLRRDPAGPPPAPRRPAVPLALLAAQTAGGPGDQAGQPDGGRVPAEPRSHGHGG